MVTNSGVTLIDRISNVVAPVLEHASLKLLVSTDLKWSIYKGFILLILSSSLSKHNLLPSSNSCTKLAMVKGLSLSEIKKHRSHYFTIRWPLNNSKKDGLPSCTIKPDEYLIMQATLTHSYGSDHVILPTRHRSWKQDANYMSKYWPDLPQGWWPGQIDMAWQNNTKQSLNNFHLIAYLVKVRFPFL